MKTDIYLSFAEINFNQFPRKGMSAPDLSRDK